MALDRVAPGRPRARALVVAVLVCAALASCGGETASTDTTAPVTAGDASVPPSAAAPSVTTGATAAVPTATTTTSAASSTTTAKRATVHDLERDLEDTINAKGSNPGRATCEASGALADWQTVMCYYNPDEPAEFGGIHVVIFDHNRYAWALGECCAGAPWPEDYATGLLCRDLLEPPPESHFQPDSNNLSYGLAVYYWVKEGRPDRMDADRNGIPCETIYPKEEVDAYWASVRVLP